MYIYAPMVASVPNTEHLGKYSLHNRNCQLKGDFFQSHQKQIDQKTSLWPAVLWGNMELAPQPIRKPGGGSLKAQQVKRSFFHDLSAVAKIEKIVP